MNKKAIIFGSIFLGLLAISIGTYAVFFKAPEKNENEVKNDNNIVEENIVTPEANIKVYSPKSNDEIDLPLIISGEARVFENQFNYELKDDSGKILNSGSLYANSPDIGQFGPFNKQINYEAPNTETGILEVFDYSAKDGTKENIVSIPVKFKKVESMNIKVFFGNSKLDKEMLDCQKVFSVNRRIAKTSEVARAAINELLEGLRSQEFQDGYFTNINQGVKIQKLTIENGTAKIDFDEMLEAGVGGSCKVASIRSQIVNTLKQFSSVKNVIISINGRTEDILQP